MLNGDGGFANAAQFGHKANQFLVSSAIDGWRFQLKFDLAIVPADHTRLLCTGLAVEDDLSHGGALVWAAF